MKEIELIGLEKKVYYEKLNNGLAVYMIPYTDKKNFYISYATRFGSTTTEFVPQGRGYSV